jgi:phenylalanyl-tRNA synthetase beta chain
MDLLKKLSPEGKPPEPTPVKLSNPMTLEMEYLRPTFRANLLTAFAANRRYEEGSIRLFEVGKVYIAKGKDLPEESDTICAVMGGLRNARSWQDNDKTIDFFDVKGIAENLLMRHGFNPRFAKGQDAGLHPNKQAEIYLDEKKVGVIGEVHPKVMLAFDIAEPVYILEIDLKSLVPFLAALREYKPVPRFPSIVRDMALIVDDGVTNETIQNLVRSFPLVEGVEIFDVYSGGQLTAGKKSLAYHISFRSPKHTLTEEEVNQVQQQILNRLSTELGATLRS